VGRQRAEMHARALVAAVLRPHHREDAELGEIRLAAEQLLDARVFLARETVAFEDLGVDHREDTMACTGARETCPARSIDSKITGRPPPPSSGSQARSGCGIMPTTLRPSLQIEAIALIDPFGFAWSVTRPLASV